MKDDRLHIFMHIHKTGGSTLQKIISRNYPRNATLHIPHLNASGLYSDLSYYQKRKIQMIRGHFPFGIHNTAPGQFTYITMLRNPVDRMISAYHFILSRPNLGVYKQVSEKKMNIIEFMTSGIKGIIENGQTRMIAGATDLEYGACTENTFNQAVHNIENYFSVVGLSEKFDESLLLMANELGWKRTWYLKANITRKKPALSSFSNEEIETIKKYNAWDIKLFEYCSGRLNEQWKNNPQLHSKLEPLRRKNKKFEKLRKIKDFFNRN